MICVVLGFDGHQHLTTDDNNIYQFASVGTEGTVGSFFQVVEDNLAFSYA